LLHFVDLESNLFSSFYLKMVLAALGFKLSLALAGQALSG
jgi:hypothetical protein